MWTGGRLQYDQHMETCWFETSRDFLTVYQADIEKMRDEMKQVGMSESALSNKLDPDFSADASRS